MEFDENIVFQTPCDKCSNIKTCREARHRLVDWRPTRLAEDGTVKAQTTIEPEHPMGKGSGVEAKKPRLKKKKGYKVCIGMIDRVTYRRVIYIYIYMDNI